jgi:hypothetical protein
MRKEFIEWLSGPLARYRDHIDAHVDKPQRSAVAQWMLLAERNVTQALDERRFDRMPDASEAAAWYAAHKAGRDWRQAVNDRDTVAIAKFLRRAGHRCSADLCRVGDAEPV